ncbi:MAG: aldo/keto reductase, partial [Massilioclostridium sp.]
MEQFKLSNGISIPKIGLGVWQSGEQTEQAVSWALQEGYRHIDTASFYQNERQVGMAIQSSGIPRNQIFITTKLWVDDIQLGRLDSALQDSMERLGVDYL